MTLTNLVKCGEGLQLRLRDTDFVAFLSCVACSRPSSAATPSCVAGRTKTQAKLTQEITDLTAEIAEYPLLRRAHKQNKKEFTDNHRFI